MMNMSVKLIFLTLSTLSLTEGRLFQSWGEPTEPAEIYTGSSSLQNHRRDIATGEFSPLACNLDEQGDSLKPVCEDFKEAFPFNTTTDVITIPCGTCYTMKSFIEGETISLGGLNIIGFLEFPQATEMTIKTPFIFVQGKLYMRSTGEVGPEEKVKFILTGDDDVKLVPEEPNAALCPSDGCNVGSRPVVVAGGKLDIQGIPSSCPPWTYSKHIDTVVKMVEATVGFEGLQKNPIRYEFADNINHWNGNIGAKAKHVVEDDNSYLKIYNRRANWQGPFFDIPITTRRVMSAEHDYIWSAKIKLSRDDGEAIQCIQSKEPCLSLQLNHMSNLERIGWIVKVPEIKIKEADVWTQIGGLMRFDPSEIDDDQVFSALTFRGPESGVDISVDDFVMTNKNMVDAEERAKKGISVCENLVENGDADDYVEEGLVTPFESWFRNETLTLEKEDDGNNYFYLADRHKPYSTMKFNILPDCTVTGTKYTFKMMIGVESEKTVEPKVMMKIYHPEGSKSKFSFRLVARCGAVNKSKGWVECSSEYVFTEEHEYAAKIEIMVVTAEDSYSPIKYDKISMTPYEGVKLPRSTDGCWGVGAKALIGNLGFYDTDQVVEIASSSKGDVTFGESVFPPTPLSETEKFATEVALLSRNIAFESDSATSGGHLLVLKTNAKQKLVGAAFKGFGQEGVKDRYPINFHMAGDVGGSSLAKNLIIDSHYRCIVLSGTSRLKLIENVAFNTKGHCYVLQDGSETKNFFQKNLGAKTQPTEKGRNLETDSTPATFYISNPSNVYEGNVAGGGSGTGFWFNLLSSVTGESAKSDLYSAIEPKHLPLGNFESNVAHSNNIGLKTYPGEFVPTLPADFKHTTVYRNKEKGMFFHKGKNIVVSDGIVADNLVGIDVELSSSVKILSTEVIGKTGFVEVCEFNDDIVGIQVSPNADPEDTSGTLLQDITFTNINGCSSAIATKMNDKFESEVYNAKTSFKRLNFEDVEVQFSACGATDKGLTKLVVDDNGSLNPKGNFKGKLVSSDMSANYKECMDIGGCSNFCYDEEVQSEDCNREVTINVSPKVSTDTQLVVMQGEDIKFIDGAILLDGTNFWANRLSYSLSLPLGNYNATFRDKTTEEEVWPVFAEVIKGDPPLGCTFYMEEFLINPMDTEADTCDELLKNGDFTAGKDFWEQNGCNLELVTGYKGNGLKTKKRETPSEGMAQSLDTRCMTTGSKYEVKAKVKLVDQNGGTPTCDYTRKGSGPGYCPRANVKSSIGGETTYVDLGFGTVNVPWTAGEWNYIYGTFSVTPSMIEADSVYLYFDGPQQDYDFIIDDVEIINESGMCEDLVSNGDFYDGTKDWSYIGAGTGIELVDGVAGKGLATIGRSQWFFGMAQLIDTKCLIAENINKEYEVSLDVKMLGVEDGKTTDCDPFNYYFSEKACPAIALRILNGDNGSLREIRYIGETAGPWKKDEWNKIYGSFRLTQDLIFEQKHLQFFIMKAWGGNNLVIDNVSMKPKDQTEKVDKCDDLIKNGSGEIGDARDWFIKGSSGTTGTLELVSPGATGDYAFFHHGDRKNIYNGMMTQLDMDCMATNSVWNITFQMKLLNATDGVYNEIKCDKSLGGYTGDERENCPEVYIESKTPDGGTKVTSLRNQHPAEEWDEKAWNPYEIIFTMPQAHRVHEQTWLFIHKVKVGYGYMIDDIHMAEV